MSRYQIDKSLWGGDEVFDALMAEIRGRRQQRIKAPTLVV